MTSKYSVSHRVVAAGLSAALLVAPATMYLHSTPVFADKQQERDEAKARLDTLSSELSATQDRLAAQTEELETLNYALAEKETQIEETQATLEHKKLQLSDIIRDSFKSGSETLIDFVVESSSPEDFISRLYYVGKISEHKQQAIDTVMNLQQQLKQEKSELEAKRQELEARVAEMQKTVEAYEARLQEVQATFEKLDAELQEEIRQREENARIAAALAAAEARRSQQAAIQQQQQATGQQSSQNTVNTSTSTTTQSNSRPVVGGGLGTAMSLIGKPYVFGAAGPSAFDCSGLICYVYGYGRGRTTYAMISSLKSSGSWKTDMSQLNVGDLVFPNSGHVGIYTGNGRYVHAANPGLGVIEGPLYGFIGGGSY